jgi:hypothetical protein
LEFIMKRNALVSFFALLALATTAHADVKVQEPWVRATVPQQQATGVFMTLTSDKDAKLVEARSPVAGVVEIHEMAMEGDVMRMRALPQGLELPAGKPVELKPGGYHVMLINLKQAVKAGDIVPVTLVVEGKDGKKASIDIKAQARPLGTAAGAGAGAPMGAGAGMGMQHQHGMKH